MDTGKSLMVWMFSIGLLMGSLTTTALAAEDTCRQQIHQLCADVPHGQGQRRACIDQHLSQLSPECQEKVKMWRDHHQNEGAHQHSRSMDAPSETADPGPGR